MCVGGALLRAHPVYVSHHNLCGAVWGCVLCCLHLRVYMHTVHCAVSEPYEAPASRIRGCGCVCACLRLRSWAVQGQVVLTDTTAGFRCSPRSHLVFEDALRYLGVKPSGRPDDWAKLRDDHYPVLRKVSLVAAHSVAR